jgi:hypothetical protein
VGEVKLLPVWQRNDAKITADAISFWRKLDALPPNVSPESRAKELCVAAYLEKEVVGVSTIALDVLPQLRCHFGFFRCLVAPQHRQEGLARKLSVLSRRVLAKWSEENRSERVLGMAAIVDNPKLDELSKAPVWSVTPGLNGLTLIGYTVDGRQIRVSWFEHARLD